MAETFIWTLEAESEEEGKRQTSYWGWDEVQPLFWGHWGHVWQWASGGGGAVPPAAPAAAAEVIGVVRGASQTGREQRPTEPADSGTQTSGWQPVLGSFSRRSLDSGKVKACRRQGRGGAGPAQGPASGLGQESPYRSQGRGWGRVSEQR